MIIIDDDGFKHKVIPISVLENVKDELLNKLFSVTNPKNTYEYINVVSLADIETVIDKYIESEDNNAEIK